MDIIDVDGAFGEGGGQIIRNGVTLATILKKKIRVFNIRANRPNPGLASQHYESIRALLQLSGGRSSALSKGSTSFDLDPTPISNQSGPATTNQQSETVLETTIDLKTAGSVTLCIQGILPYLLTLPNPFKITIIGGTHVLKAPNTDYMDRVFIPTMKSIGYSFDVDLIRPGYFPRGGGCVTLTAPFRGQPALDKFPHFHFNDRGHLLQSNAILNLTPPLFDRREGLVSKVRSIDSRSIETRRVSYASVEYFLKYEHAAFGFYRLLEGRPPKPTFDQVREAIEQVEAEVKGTLTSDEALSVDTFMQDQLIIYMTLAKLQDGSKSSSFTTSSPLTDHTLSAIHVSQLLTGLKFEVTGVKGGLTRITL